MFRFFHRLQWKLTLSYAIVTAGTVVVLTTLFIGIAVYFETQKVYFETQNSRRAMDSFYWSKTAFRDNIPRLLDDPQALQTWLDRVQKTGFIWDDFQSNVVPKALDYANWLEVITHPIYVLDTDLNLIAIAPPDDADLIGKPFRHYSTVGGGFIYNGAYKNRPIPQGGMKSILEAALVGDENYDAQSIAASDGTYLVAFPLHESDADSVAPLSFTVSSRLRLPRRPTSIFTKPFSPTSIFTRHFTW